MHINRLNLIFPPGTPGPAGVQPAPSDALQPEGGKARAPAAGVGMAPSRPVPTAEKPNLPPTPANSGVTLELGSGQKAAGGTYTREGVLHGRASAAVDQTPAEQFVASAVNILRDFDASKLVQGSAPEASRPAEALSASRFGSLRQAVAKLNVFA